MIIKKKDYMNILNDYPFIHEEMRADIITK